MSKQIVDSYIFSPSGRTVTLPDFDSIDLSRLALITNVTTGQFLFNFADQTLGATVSGNVITLEHDTSSMSSTDKLRIDYDVPFSEMIYDKTVVGNSRSKFRDGFASHDVVQPNPETWDLAEDTAGAHIITQGGDSSGSSYLRISLSPFVEANGLSLTSKKKFQFPMRIGFGLSASQRILGQEFFAGVVGCDKDGVVETITPVADKLIGGTTVSITSNVATITIVNHGFRGGDRVVIHSCADHRLNVGPVVVTVLTADTFTVPIVLTNASYSSVGGYVRTADPLRYAKNGSGLLFENTTVTNASFVSRRNGAKFRSLNSTVGSTTATQTNTNPFTDSFNATTTNELFLSMDEVLYRSYAADGVGSMNGLGKFTQSVPDEEISYKIQLRARNLNGFSIPVGKVVSAAKSGTTTATVTTDVPHGLVAGDFVQIYGTRDQTNFAQLSTQTAIASVPSSTTFTVVWGSAVTATTAGGVVWVNQGQLAAPGVIGQSVQSISRVNGVLAVVGSAAWSGPVAGEYVQLHGLESNSTAYEGAYKVLRVNTTTLELEAPGADFTTLTTGGAVIRRTDVRLHFARVMDYTRLGVEILGGKGNTSDINNAVPVSIAGSANLTINTPAVTQSTGVNTTQWSAAGWGGFLVNDIVSAAITSTATSGTITPGSVANIGTYAHTFHVAVTAVSGTSPTMDIGIEESADNGTNWVRIYDFPRITANGSYQSPMIRATLGTRYRYVRTIGGTSPSFTMSLNRVQFSMVGEMIKQFFDRSIVLTTLNSTTPAYYVDACNFFQVTVNLGAATTAPVLQFEGSEDATNWYAIGSTFTPAASTTTVQVHQNIMPRFARVRVATAGATVTAGYVSIKALNP